MTEARSLGNPSMSGDRSEYENDSFSPMWLLTDNLWISVSLGESRLIDTRQQFEKILAPFGLLDC